MENYSKKSVGKLLIYSFFWFYFTMTFYSCERKPSISKEDKIIAQVGDEVLTEHYLIQQIPPLPSYADSLAYQKQYVKKWIQNILLIQEFKKNHPDWKTFLHQKLKECENQVLLTELFTEITNQLQNGKEPSTQTLYAFYLKHDSLFPASEPYYQFLFGICKTLSNALLLRRNFRQDSLPLFLSKLQKQTLYSKADTSWLTYKESISILNQIQLSPDLDQLTLKRPYLYWVKYEGKNLPALFILLNRIQKGEAMPFPRVQNEIKFFYLYTLKERYLDSLSQKLYQNAQKKNAIHIHFDLD